MIAVKISSRPLVTFDRMLTRIGADCRKIYYEPSEGDYEKICAIAEQIFSDPSDWNELYSELEKQKPAESEYIPDRFTIDKKTIY